MLSLNESIDFEFFETTTKSSTSSSKVSKVDAQKTSSGISSSFLDVWEIDSGSLRYSGSHASLLNNLAFESSTDTVKERHRENAVSQSKAKCPRYNEIKRTVALATDQDVRMNIEMDDSSSNLEDSSSNLEESSNELCENKTDERIQDIRLKNPEMSESKIMDETEKRENRTENDEKENASEKLNEDILNDEVRADEGDMHTKLDSECEQLDEKDAAIADHFNEDNGNADFNEEENGRPNIDGERELLNGGENELETVEVFREEILQADRNRQRTDVNNKTWDSGGSQDDEILYVCKKYNQITTIVEVHAENDLTDDDSVLEHGIEDDNLIPIEENVDRIENSVEMDKDMFEEFGIAETPYETAREIESSEECHTEDINKNYKNNKSDLNNQVESDFKLDNSMEVAQSLNQIKNYTAKTSDTIGQVYSYEAIEKKIENANKLMANVKTINVVETKSTDLHQVNNNKVKLVNTRQSTNFKPIQNTNFNKPSLAGGKSIHQSDKFNTVKAPNSPRSEPRTINSRGKQSPRQELPKLNKPNTKPLSEVKPNLKKPEEKIPDIKNEAGFDMRLLMKAINELENTKPKSTTCTRSNSGRSSDISKKSSKSNKSNTSTSSKRANMSFTKEEQKKIDLENQILLKKIMSQKPQQPPQPGTQIRRKPTAYINRQKLQDRISHDNTILERKLMSIKKRKERISIL